MDYSRLKRCSGCGEEKETSFFYTDPSLKDGYRSKCKTCTAAVMQAYGMTAAGQAAHAAASRKYIVSPRGRQTRARCVASWYQRDRMRAHAHRILNGAVRAGRVERRPCEVCGTPRLVHGHHDDYREPLAVRWLCPRHHKEAHMRLRAIVLEDEAYKRGLL